MEAKDKAKELIEKFTNYFGKDSDEVNEEKAINFALICCDEILKTIPYSMGNFNAHDYYHQVKTEIQNYEN